MTEPSAPGAPSTETPAHVAMTDAQIAQQNEYLEETAHVGGEDAASFVEKAEEQKAPITGASEPGYLAPSILETASHPHEMVDRMHSLLDGLEASVGPADVMRVRELRNILNHLGATKSTG
jgi:hypothetical protein